MSRGNPAMLTMLGGPSPEGDLNGPLDKSQFRPKHLGQAPDFQAICRSGEFMACTYMGMASVEVARSMANLGFDFIFLDFSEGETSVLVRVPSFDHVYISWVLDSGAAGIIVPHTETREQAERVVAAARFPPLGHRSFPPFATIPGVTDGLHPPKKHIFDMHNNHPAIIMQIESKKGCENAMEILGVPGVNAAMIGSGDLCLDLGVPGGLENPGPAYLEASNQVFDAAKRHGDMPVFSGFFFSEADISKAVQLGYRAVIITSDVTAMCYGQMAALIEARKLVKTLDGQGKVRKPARTSEAGAPQDNANGNVSEQ